MYYFIIGLKIYAAINAIAILGITIFHNKVAELYDKWMGDEIDETERR